MVCIVADQEKNSLALDIFEGILKVMFKANT